MTTPPTTLHGTITGTDPSGATVSADVTVTLAPTTTIPPVPVTPPVPGKPDFRLTAHTMEVNGAPATKIVEGDRVAFVSVVKNIGGAAVPGTILDVGTYIDADPGPPPINAVPTVWEDTNVGGLASGATVVVKTTGGPAGVNYWTATPGPHDIWGVVDPNAALLGRYAESDTSNNTMKFSITVAKATAPTSPPPTTTPGGKAAVVKTRGAMAYTGGGPNGVYQKTAESWYGTSFVYVLQNLNTDNIGLVQMVVDGYGPNSPGNLHPIPVMSFPLAGGGVGPPPAGQSLADVANGAFDGFFTQVAQIGKGLPQGWVCRLGWEFNGSWYSWNITGTQNGVPRPECNPANYKRAFIRARDVIATIDPRVKFDWCLNGGIALWQQMFGVDPKAAYPGSTKVDYLGLDEYEALAQGGAFGQLVEDFNWMQSFARDTSTAGSGGKAVTYPEFGLYLPPHENVTEANHIPWLTKIGDLMESQPASGPGSLGYNLCFEIGEVSDATNWAGMHGVSVPAQQYWATRIS